MKSSIRTIALAALVVIASMSPTMHAQTGAPTARVNVPFSFDYGSKHFAHGVYTLSMINADVLLIRGNSDSAMGMVRAASEPVRNTNSVVIFRRYGDRYFVTELVLATRGTRLAVNESKAEKHAAREFAMRGQQPTELALAIMPERSLSN